MKTIPKLLYVSMVIVAVFTGCKKDEINPGLTPFGQRGGDALVQAEDYVDAHRGNLTHPDACDQIARLKADEIAAIIYEEIPEELDLFVKVATGIYRDPDQYKKWYDGSFGRNDFIKELGGEAIMDDNLRRCLSYYPRMFKDRVIVYVVDGICYGGGVRDQWTDDVFQNMFMDTISAEIEHEYWIPTNYDELYYYLYYFAVDPGNYAEAKKMNAPTPTIQEMQAMFPVEEIKKQTNLNAYREQTRQKYDFRQPDWKALPVNSTK